MIGIIKLNTNFPRLRGDIGNRESFSIPVEYETVALATVDSVVSNQLPCESVILQIIEAAQRLEKKGATVIGTSCGFLSLVQNKVQRSVSVPVITSSLVLIPALRSIFGLQVKIAVLTFDAQLLSAEHTGDELGRDILTEGLPKSGELYNCIKQDLPTLNADAALKEVLGSAKSAVSKNSHVDLFLLECTNLSPYKKHLREHFGKPVFDLIDALLWVGGSSAPVR